MLKVLVVSWIAALPIAAQTYTFSEGGRPSSLEFAPGEVYITLKPGANQPAVISSIKSTLNNRLRQVTAAGSNGLIVELSKADPAAISSLNESAAPVFYDTTIRGHNESARRILTSKLLVRSGESRWDTLRLETGAIGRKESLLKGWTLVEYASPFAALAATNWIARDGGFEFTPVFARQFHKRQAKASGPLQRSVNDPLFANQWHLANDGPGIRMNAAWDVATGKGINVTVVDDGLDIANEDLAANAYPLATGNHRNFNSGDPANPTPAMPDQNHGTNCAGLIAAVGFNNIGVIGVAPEARLMGLRLIAEPAGDDSTGAALAWQPNGLTTHVSSNSWGPADNGKDPGRMGPLQAAAIELAATTYRNGLGTIFSVSAGNGRQSGDDASYDGFSASRYVIGVGAVNRNGEPSSYSEQGMNVAVSAFGGEFNPPDVLWTTNNSGPEALAALQTKFPSSVAPVNYSDAFNGTSAAAPQVSGAAALLLERNPKLGYRDVKEILMKTATRTGLKNGDDFRDNGAGFSFSHSFGAGVINVSAALDLAPTWTNLVPVRSASAVFADSKAIPDGAPEGASFSFDFSAISLRVEHVELTVNVDHPNRGDIGFLITSPSGMISLANNRPPDDGAGFVDYLFTSVRHWGESSKGTWTVRVIDITQNGVAGRAGNITLRVYGTPQ